jgi:hypothetical protein
MLHGHDLGEHSSSYKTDKYRHLIDGQREETAAAFDAFVNAATGK